jgi:hypothetical protein
VVAPGIQVYVFAPDAVIVAVAPIQIDVGDEILVIVGVLMFTNTVFVPAQTPPFVPVTVYTVITVGETTTVPPVIAPGIHVYDVAPVADNVDVPPRHIRDGEADAVIVGVLNTVMEIVFVLEHVPFTPLTVYVVLTVGVTTIVPLVNAPGFQV